MDFYVDLPNVGYKKIWVSRYLLQLWWNRKAK